MNRKLDGLSRNARLTLIQVWMLEWASRQMSAITRSSDRSMAAHIAAVLSFLGQAGASLQLLMAGTFHDWFEDYLKGDPEEKKTGLRAKLRKYLIELADYVIQQAGHDETNPLEPEMLEQASAIFIERVITMIECVTEPRGEGVSWRERKKAFLDQVSMADDETVVLAIVLKIESLKEGVDVHADGRATTCWSKAGLDENCWFFSELQTLFHSRNVPEVLLEIYDHLLAVFKKGPRQKIQAA